MKAREGFSKERETQISIIAGQWYHTASYGRRAKGARRPDPVLPDASRRALLRQERHGHYATSSLAIDAPALETPGISPHSAAEELFQ